MEETTRQTESYTLFQCCKPIGSNGGQLHSVPGVKIIHLQIKLMKYIQIQFHTSITLILFCILFK